MVYKFELTVVNSSHSYPMHIWGCAWIYRWPKKLLKIRTGLLLERCGPRGHHRLTAIGLLATGPWVTGLLLAKLLLGITVISRQIENNACAKCFGQTRCGTMWKWKIMQRWDRSKHISIIHCISGIVELHSVKFSAFFWFTSVWKPGSLEN